MSDKKQKKNKRKNSLKMLLGGIKDELDQNIENQTPPSEEVVKALAKDFAFIPIDQIERNSDQPRQDFDATELEDLKKSIKVHGLIQPITVRRMAEGQYQLISGERRWRASKLAELEEIPAFIRIAGDAEMMEMALIENTHRSDLNPIEIATTYARLKKDFNYTDAQLAERVESSRTAITNYRRLLSLPAEIQNALKDRTISMGHARTILGEKDYSRQLEFLEILIEDELSVRELEKLIRISKGGPIVREVKNKEPKASPTPQKTSLSYEYVHVQDRLSQYLGSKVQLKRDAKTGKGAVTINFADDDDLNRLLELIEE